MSDLDHKYLRPQSDEPLINWLLRTDFNPDQWSWLNEERRQELNSMYSEALGPLVSAQLAEFAGEPRRKVPTTPDMRPLMESPLIELHCVHLRKISVTKDDRDFLGGSSLNNYLIGQADLTVTPDKPAEKREIIKLARDRTNIELIRWGSPELSSDSYLSVINSCVRRAGYGVHGIERDELEAAKSMPTSILQAEWKKYLEWQALLGLARLSGWRPEQLRPEDLLHTWSSAQWKSAESIWWAWRHHWNSGARRKQKSRPANQDVRADSNTSTPEPKAWTPKDAVEPGQEAEAAAWATHHPSMFTVRLSQIRLRDATLWPTLEQAISARLPTISDLPQSVELIGALIRLQDAYDHADQQSSTWAVKALSLGAEPSQDLGERLLENWTAWRQALTPPANIEARIPKSRLIPLRAVPDWTEDFKKALMSLRDLSLIDDSRKELEKFIRKAHEEELRDHLEGAPDRVNLTPPRFFHSIRSETPWVACGLLDNTDPVLQTIGRQLVRALASNYQLRRQPGQEWTWNLEGWHQPLKDRQLSGKGTLLDQLSEALTRQLRRQLQASVRKANRASNNRGLQAKTAPSGRGKASGVMRS